VVAIYLADMPNIYKTTQDIKANSPITVLLGAFIYHIAETGEHQKMGRIMGRSPERDMQTIAKPHR